METFNSTFPPNNVNPRFQNDDNVPRSTGAHTNGTYATGASNAGAHTSTYHTDHAGTETHPTHATTGAHALQNDPPHSKMEGIKTALHDIKENVKGTLQRDHHHGQDCAKRPQDGKTNPME
ncbi:uncharacterized protein EV154DRAFT_503175 [Mucor mucedo]|uniref:Uncharacterized protein n=1 Tax=Mucor saturninus TaxID=64648 RepID=A0A8H7VCA2_9FUNG|nr:uncharacterized protein EV154DRAFT_503175 [Mucor mucedo]KAG2209154.1 hypothetical protein INT47_005446 [Mucor saturninus]KAI7893074.1 hypothetical protein EV154DRAFT_503175 [Mucor mucedo]